MAFGLGEQLEPGMWKQIEWDSDRPWKVQTTQWRGYYKKMKTRRERRRAKIDPTCNPEYRRFKGWEY